MAEFATRFRNSFRHPAFEVEAATIGLDADEAVQAEARQVARAVIRTVDALTKGELTFRTAPTKVPKTK